MTKAFEMTAALWVVAAMLAGCNKGAASAKTPKEAIANFAKALETADRDLFLATVSVGPGEKEFVDATFDMISATTDFVRAMEKAYGKEAGARYQRGPFFSDEELAGMEIKVEGDKATATPKGGGKPMPLVKKDGAWRVDLSFDMPPPDKRGKMIEEFRAATKIMVAVRAKIGTPGMTKEKIAEEMAAAGKDLGTGD